MPPILATNPNTQSRTQSRWDYYKNLANMVCSRESTYRTALDITAFDIPVLAADAFRGIKKFLESVFECFSATIMVGISPYLTAFVGKILGKQILSKELQKDTINLLKFNMNELRDFEQFKTATQRLKTQEVEDKLFVSSLYEKSGKKKEAEFYRQEALDIEKFCSNFKADENKMKEIYKLKKATIIGESFVEGGWWGGYGLMFRLFRKYILQEDRFTGTKGYVSDAESEQLGEAGDLSIFQKVVGVASIFISPILNTILLNKIEDREAVKNNKYLKIVDNHMDMTHGVYPRLGLLFTQTTIPKWIGTITLSQGWFERTERILKLLTVIPSWWFGHRATNGIFALNADKELAKKYDVEQGILVEPEYLKQTANNDDTFFERIQKRFPEPAKIHHVFKAVDKTGLDEARKEELRLEAEDKHARCLYKGFTLHSLGVFAINMAVNYSTKLRALWALRN